MPDAATLYNDENTKKPGYFREITLLDQQVGKLRQALRDLDIAENTLLFYCSDNGGLVAESSGGRARKGSIYEGGLRVPAVLEWPARYKAKSIDTPAFASDLYPTLVAIAGATVDHQAPLDGIDLTPVIAGTRTERPPIVAAPESKNQLVNAVHGALRHYDLPAPVELAGKNLVKIVTRHSVCFKTLGRQED